jgi:hypothetical protein
VFAVGGIINARWAHDGIVTTGPYCTAQTVMYQLGALGTAMITLVRLVLFMPLWSRAYDTYLTSQPDSHRAHIRVRSMASRIESTRPCCWPGWLCMHLLCALCWYWRWHSQRLWSPYSCPSFRPFPLRTLWSSLTSSASSGVSSAPTIQRNA